MQMEVKAMKAVMIQKLSDTLNEAPIANNKVTIHQLKRAHKSVDKLKSLLKQNDDLDMLLLYEVEDEIEKFAFRIARQRKRFDFLNNQTIALKDLHYCRILIRKIIKITSKISNSHDEASTRSSTVWPISPVSPPIPITKKKPLTRSLTTTPYLADRLPQTKKLTLTYSYNNQEMTQFGLKEENDDVLTGSVLIERYNGVSDNSKVCLLYTSLFPKGEDISVRRLIRLWQAEGFVKKTSQPPFPEDLVLNRFDDLVNRGLIEITKLRADNGPKRCRLAPVLHNHLSQEAQHIGLFNVHTSFERFEDAAGPFGVRRIVHHTSSTDAIAADEQNRQFDPSTLRSYLSFNRPRKDTPAREVQILLNQIIKSRFCLLRTLDLEGVNKPNLPKNIGDLCNLRYLGLRRTYLDDLPKSVGDLLNLETLDVKRTCIQSLPDSISKLKHLRNLNLNDISLALPRGSSLTLFHLWGLVVDEKISITEGLGMLNLRELGMKFKGLSIESQSVLVDWIAKLVNLQNLRLRSVDKMGNPSKLVLKSLIALEKLSHLNLYGNLERIPNLNEFPPNVKVLALSISQLSNDPMNILGQLPCLMVLRLLGDSFIGKKILCCKGGFKKLEVLKLWSLNELEEWDVEEDVMENLKDLEIRNCPKLKIVPSRLLLKTRRLDELRLTNMPDEFVGRVKIRESMVKSLRIKQMD